MKRNNRVRINPKTNAPVNIPQCASEHLCLRITPSLKNYFRNQATRQKLSMTKYVLNIFDQHLDYPLSNEFLLDNHAYKHNNKRNAGKSKEEDLSSWDGLQKVWNFFKCV